jgi:SulP family sulfate permease
VTRFKSNGITLGFTGIKKQVQEVMGKTNLISSIGQSNIFATDQEAFEVLYRQGVIDTRISMAHTQHAAHLAAA